MTDYTMDELLTQREHAVVFGVDNDTLDDIDREIDQCADVMANEVDAVLGLSEQPFDWEADDDGC